MYFVLAIILGVISAGATIAAMFVLRRQVARSIGDEKAGIEQTINQTDSELELLAGYSEDYVSRAQLDSIIGQQVAAKTELENAKNTLKEIESKLEVAQKNVDEKEAKQQELKTAKEEEQSKLDELAGKFDSMNDESVTLERELATSMKELDQLMDEVTATEGQKEILQALSNALTSAGSRLRDLISEYQSVNERLEGLKAQHLDLEDEYTKLVEQQLGG